MEYLGMKIKALRQEKSITQKNLADFLEIAPATVSAYETGSNYPSVDIVIKLCKFFNVSADYLLGLSDKKEFNMTDLTDEQYQAITSLITRFRRFNSTVSD